MTTRSHTAALIVLCLVTIASGAVARSVVSYWASAERFEELANRLHDCPPEVEGWDEMKSVAFGENVLHELRCHGFLNRIYQDQRSGHQLQVAVLLGEPDGISVHTPQVCYTSTEYELDEAPKIQLVEESGRSHEVWTTTFRRRDAGGQKLCVLHAWSTDGLWHADKRPRIKYVTAPFLYKLQVVSLGAMPSDTDRTTSFLKSFIRELRPCMDSAPATP